MEQGPAVTEAHWKQLEPDRGFLSISDPKRNLKAGWEGLKSKLASWGPILVLLSFCFV